LIRVCQATQDAVNRQAESMIVLVSLAGSTFDMPGSVKKNPQTTRAGMFHGMAISAGLVCCSDTLTIEYPQTLLFG
jgi:hypothetical protein